MSEMGIKELSDFIAGSIKGDIKPAMVKVNPDLYEELFELHARRYGYVPVPRWEDMPKKYQGAGALWFRGVPVMAADGVEEAEAEY